MAKQWKQLTSEEVKNHSLNTKGGLSSFIAFLCAISALGLGAAFIKVTEIYKAVSDVNLLPSQDSTLLVAIIPSLIYVIIFAFLIKHKTKHTLKFVIGVLWAVPIVSFLHALIFWDYVGASGVPPEVTLSNVGQSIWVIIFTIGLVLYSFLSKKYNLQYLHRIKIDSNDNINSSPENNLDDAEQLKNTQDIDSSQLLAIKSDNRLQKPSAFEDTSILQNEPTSKSIFNQEPIETEKTTSEKFNLILSVICGTAILIATPFAYTKYIKNLKCLENENTFYIKWEENFNNYLAKHLIWLRNGENIIQEEYQKCLSKSNSIFSRYNQGNDLLSDEQKCMQAYDRSMHNLMLEKDETIDIIKYKYSIDHPRQPKFWCYH